MTFKKRKLIVMVAFDLFQVCPRNPLKRGFLLVRGGEVGVGAETPLFIVEVAVNIMKDGDGDGDTPTTHSQNKRHLL